MTRLPQKRFVCRVPKNGDISHLDPCHGDTHATSALFKFSGIGTSTFCLMVRCCTRSCGVQLATSTHSFKVFGIGSTVAALVRVVSRSLPRRFLLLSHWHPFKHLFMRNKFEHLDGAKSSLLNRSLQKSVLSCALANIKKHTSCDAEASTLRVHTVSQEKAPLQSFM